MSESIKVLLINPPFHRLFGEKKQWFPLGIYYLREFLNTFEGISAYAYNADNSDLTEGFKNLTYRERYFNSEYYDVKENNDIWKEIENKISEFRPNIIGIYSFSEGYSSALKIKEIAKGIDDKIITILGGPHTECIDSENSFDYLIKGEAELKILRIILKNYPERAKEIEEVLYKKYKSEINDVYIKKVDSLPYPFSEEDKTNIKNDTKLPLLITRGGCPKSCSYCMFSIINTNVFRKRSIHNVISEIKRNYELFGTNNYFIVDDTFTIEKNLVSEFCNELKIIGFSISWSCTTHVEHIEIDLLKKMKDAGCHSIHIGVETGNPKILKLINKQTTIEKIKEKSIEIKNTGIKLKTFFMVGYPGETISDINDSKSLIKELNADETMLHIYIPYPKTRLYKHIQEKYPDFKMVDWENFRRHELQAYVYMGDDINGENFKSTIKDFYEFIETYEKNKL